MNFTDLFHELELSRRRKKENLEINSIDKAEKNFNDLFNELNCFDINVQTRLKMIKKHWKNLIMFHFIEGAPATNNSIENYYSTSLKTHRKKQFRTDIGIINQLQLSSMKGRECSMSKNQHSLNGLWFLYLLLIIKCISASFHVVVAMLIDLY